MEAEPTKVKKTVRHNTAVQKCDENILRVASGTTRRPRGEGFLGNSGRGYLDMTGLENLEKVIAAARLDSEESGTALGSPAAVSCGVCRADTDIKHPLLLHRRLSHGLPAPASLPPCCLLWGRVFPQSAPHDG